MFRIGEFAKLNKVTIKTLRYYDNIGLLEPKEVDEISGYRYYSASQMPKLNRILSLKYLGFSLNEITMILEKDMSLEKIKELLELKKFEIEEKVKEENLRLNRIENFIRYYEEDTNMKCDVVIKKVEPIKVASLRDIIPSYAEQGHLWEELVAHINKNKVKMTPPCMTIYYDPGYKEESVDAEVIEPIIGDLKETDRIKVRELEGVEEMACVVHKGPYENMSATYQVIMAWIEENGYEVIGANRELYLKSESSVKDPSELITEIQLPVRKMK